MAEAIILTLNPISCELAKMPTIGNVLKLEIESYAQSIAQSGQLILAAKRGLLTAQHIGAYVSGLRFLIRGTLGVLQRAEQRAKTCGDWALSAHYGQKLREESGHDRWAEHDLLSLPPTALYGSNAPQTALGRLVTYLDHVTDREPSLLLPYMLLVEYLTVLAAPDWLEMLESNCGIPQSSLSVITKHVALDKEHAAEGVDVIDRLVSSPGSLEPMLGVLRKSLSYFQEFWTEVLSTAPLAA
jgi:hypothetical protein